jgi:hypothetical protein
VKRKSPGVPRRRPRGRPPPPVLTGVGGSPIGLRSAGLGSGGSGRNLAALIVELITPRVRSSNPVSTPAGKPSPKLSRRGRMVPHLAADHASRKRLARRVWKQTPSAAPLRDTQPSPFAKGGMEKPRARKNQERRACLSPRRTKFNAAHRPETPAPALALAPARSTLDPPALSAIDSPAPNTRS